MRVIFQQEERDKLYGEIFKMNSVFFLVDQTLNERSDAKGFFS